MQPLKAFIFDIDGTLTTDNSWIALTREMGADISMHERINSDYITSKLTLTEATNQLVALWRATGNANKKFITTLLENIPISSDVPAVIARLRNQDYKICLITGSFDLYAKIVADRLKVEDYYANSRFVWDESDNLSDFIYLPQQALQKLHHLREFCTQYDIQLTDCATVGDDYNDIEIFKATGHGIALERNKIPELESVAWKKIANLNELLNLL